MNIVVFGASGGSGRAAIEQLCALGHQVRAFARGQSAAFDPRVQVVTGDALERADVEAAVAGQDAVIVTLGIRENPFRVRLFGPARTTLAVRSEATKNIIAAMHKHGVRRLVVQTSYGVGETRARLGFVDKLFFELILKPQIADTEKQEADVMASGLDWVIAQPVHLTDAAHGGMPFVSVSGETQSLKVSRKSVGHFLAHSAEAREFIGRSVALSGVA